MNGLRRVPWIVFLTALAVMILMPVAAAQAWPAAVADNTNQVISGKVYAGPSGSTPATGVAVQLWYRADSSSEWESAGGPSETDVSGAYSLDASMWGEYTVSYALDSLVGFQTRWWNDKADQAAANVLATDEFGTQGWTGVNAWLPRYSGSISGKATDRFTGDPISGVTVAAMLPDFTVVTAALTNGSGDFTLPYLAPNPSYKLLFSADNYNGVFWDNKSSLDEADAIAVSTTAVTAKNAQLESGVSDSVISGTVLFGAVGTANVPVQLYQLRTDPLDPDVGTYQPFGEPILTQASPPGAYSFAGLPGGAYKVVAAQGSMVGFREQWWNHQYSMADATVIAVSGMNTAPSKNITLDQYTGSVSGTVTDVNTGDPIAGVRVSVYRSDAASPYDPLVTVETNPSGDYAIPYLPSSTHYKLGFSKDTYYPTYWSDATSLDAANEFEVSGGVTGKNVQMQCSVWDSVISGTVSSGGAGAPGVMLTLYRFDRESGTFKPAGEAKSLASPAGQYQFASLMGGKYKVVASEGSILGFMPQWWDSEPSMSSATTIAVSGISTAAGKDFTLFTYPGSISGKVTNAFGGSDLSSVTVSVYAPNPDYEGMWDAVAEAQTDSSGLYSFPAIADGTYKIGFQKTPFTPQYWNSQGGLEDATPVIVDGGPVTDVNAQLEAAVSSISGVVTVGGAKAQVRVELYKEDPTTHVWAKRGESIDSDPTDGSYEFKSLTGGNYKVAFAPGSRIGFVPQWYNGTPTGADNMTDATVIALDGTDARSGINAAMSRYAGKITGKVTMWPSSTPTSGVTVTAYQGRGYSAYSIGTTTDNNGDYTIDYVADGRYLVGFEKQRFETQFYKGMPDRSDANWVVVAGGSAEASAQLEPMGSSISGTVTIAGTSKPAMVEIQLFKKNPVTDKWDNLTSAQTASGDDGAYEFTDLKAGVYRVAFAKDALVGYRPLWWNAQLDQAAATPITLTGLNEVSGASASLTPYDGAITGTVYDARDEATKLATITVTAYTWSEAYGGEWVSSESTETDRNGNYRIAMLAGGGTFRLGFSNYEEDGWTREYYNRQPDVDSATDIVVPSGTTMSGKNGYIEPAKSSIIGTVAAASALPDMAIELYVQKKSDGPWTRVDTTWTGSYEHGRYAFYGLSKGSYRVRFASDSTHGFMPTWWSGGDSVAVSGDTATYKVNQTLSTKFAGGITGTVRDRRAPNSPVVGAQAYLLQYDSEYDDWNTIETVATHSGGTYAFENYAPGTYRVAFGNGGQVYGGFQEYYDGHRSGSVADDVVVGTTVRTGIDGHVKPAFSTISGSIVDSDTKKPTAAQVTLHYFDPSTKTWVAILDTESDNGTGAYTIETFGPGEYKLEFGSGWYSDTSYTTQYWNRADTFSSAATITVSGGSLAGYDATMVAGIGGPVTGYGSIEGTITDVEDGSGIYHADVTVYKDSGSGWQAYDTALTDYNGHYHVYLANGTYRVGFAKNGFVTQYWDNKPDADAASDIVVSGDVATGKNAALEHDIPSITGTVRDVTWRQHQGGSQIRIYKQNPIGLQWEWVDSATADNDGGYAVYGLGTGVYKALAVPDQDYGYGGYDGYDAQYFDVATSLGDAKPIVTVAGTTSMGINFWLGPDVTPPTVNSVSTGTYVLAADLWMDAEDLGSGVESISYQIDDGAVVTVPRSSAGVRYTTLGNHTVSFWAKDNAGNVSGHSSFSFSVITPKTEAPGYWTKITGTGAPGKWAWSVDFVDATHGFVGDIDHLLVTSDGGASWIERALPPIVGSFTMDFVDANTGYAVGAHGQAFRTSDGGVSWTDVSVRTWVSLRSLSFVNATTGWAVGDSGETGVFRTTDAGASWTCQKTDNLGYLQGVHFANVNDGVVAGAYIPGASPRILQTHDGGSTWTEPALSATSKLSVAFQIDPSNAWVGGYENSRMFKTTNGADWSRVMPGSGPGSDGSDIMSMWFSGASSGWVASQFGAYFTSNGGNTWLLASPLSLDALSFTDASHGWALRGSELAYAGAGGGLWKYSTGTAPTPGMLGGSVTSGVPAAGFADVSVDVEGLGSAITAANGSYTIGNIPPGTYNVTFSKAGYVSQTVSVSITSGSTTTKNITLVLVPTKGVVSGTAKLAGTSTSLDGVSVTLSDSGGSAATAGGGTYAISGVSPGAYVVTFAKAGFVSQVIPGVVITAGGTTTQNVDLAPDPATSGTLRGTVRTGSTLHAGASVTLSNSGGSATTAADGTYSIPGVPAGTYTAIFKLAGYADKVVTGVAVLAGGTTTQDGELMLAAPTTGSLAGITRSCGVALPGAMVTLSGGAGTAITIADGGYLMSGVSPGTYTATLSRIGYVSKMVSAVITAGNTTTLGPITLVARPKIIRSPSVSSKTYARKSGVAKFTLSAVVKRESVIPIKSLTIYLQTSKNGRTSWKSTYTLKTNSSGKASKLLKKTSASVLYYRWYIKTSSTVATAKTGAQKIHVK